MSYLWTFAAVLPGIWFLNGWVLSLLWKWFVVPLGVSPIGIVQAIGLALIIVMLTHKIDGRSITAPKTKMLREHWEAIVSLVFRPFAFLGMGLFLKLVAWVVS